MEAKSVDGVGDWLKQNGLSVDVIKTFQENQIDGLAFIDLSEHDIRQMIKPIGCVLKILRLKSSVSAPVVTSAFVRVPSGSPPRPRYVNADMGLQSPLRSYLPRPQAPTSLYLRNSPSRFSLSPSPLRQGFTSPPLSDEFDSMPGSSCHSESVTRTSKKVLAVDNHNTSSAVSVSSEEVTPKASPKGSHSKNTSIKRVKLVEEAPTGFEIPTMWRPSIMSAIDEEELIPDTRNEIVRDLVVHMYASMNKPNPKFCRDVARKLVSRYEFMKDSGKGSGYGSWEKKLIERVNNSEKQRNRKRKRTSSADDHSPSPKRGRPKKVTQSRYPQPMKTVSGDSQKSLEALHSEMKKDHPRKEVILPLMKNCFSERREFVVNEAKCAMEIIQKYPALKLPSVMIQEMEIIINKPDIYKTFTLEWKEKWAPAVLMYSRKLKRKDILDIVKNCDDTEGDDAVQKTALVLLCKLLPLHVPKTKVSSDGRSSTGDSYLNCIYEEHPISNDPEMLAKMPPARNGPRFAELTVVDGNSNFFLFMEQRVVCSVSSFTKALFLWFALHYICNLEYEKCSVDISVFFQEFVFGLPYPLKKTSTYLTTTTDIQKLTLK